MKTRKQIIFFITLFATIAMEGCSDKSNEISFEISPNCKDTVIQEPVNGIEFKFYLLNEKGVPATVFKQGENFSFYFSVTNKTDQNLYFDPNIAYSNENDFCNIYSSDGQNLGKPYYFDGYDKIGSGAYPFNKATTYVFEQLWVDNRDSVWRWEYGYYESGHRNYLPIGNYYTEIKQTFRFLGEKTINTDTLHFKIKFNIL
jgi:hypothetical protein